MDGDSDDTDILLHSVPAQTVPPLYDMNMDMDDKVLEPTTAAYRFLAPCKKAELNQLNARLQSIESSLHPRENDNEHSPEHFSAPSDISTISTCTQIRGGNPSSSPQRLRNVGLVHSTPKTRLSHEKLHENENVHDDGGGVLLEIDNFLENRPFASLPNAFARFPSSSSSDHHHQPQQQQQGTVLQQQHCRDNHNLISLSELWSSKCGQNTVIPYSVNAAAAIDAGAVASMSLQEEQLRRQHLEKTIQNLQTKLLEYQQRISVAIEVDKQKDSALRGAQTLCKSLEDEVIKQRESIEKLEREQRDFNTQRDLLQKELTQAISLATKFQEKNEKLEAELRDSSRKTSECNSMYKTQIEELEVKLHGCKKSEEFAINELNKYKDRLAKAEYQSEKIKHRCDELEKENTTLKHQKETLHDLHQKLKSRTDTLEAQKKSLQDSLTKVSGSETLLKKKIEQQQKTLKLHYQQQLENVVSQKLKEFQEQLDKMEDKFKAEARDRERLIAERAVKQMELINEKNELENNLLQEKHHEEVELYRLQLANASKKIDNLEVKLSSYKSKRADIAEKLHNVMETQWQKALEILISPTSSQLKSSSLDSNTGSDTDRSSPPLPPPSRPDTKDIDVVDDHDFETPKMNRYRKSTPKKNNLNNAIKTNTDKDRQEEPDPPEPIDRLQAYIELLLSKSPSDVDKLNEILSLAARNNNEYENGKPERTVKRNINNHFKPPWKA